MAEEKITLTDPARELAELCTALQGNSNKTGETFLAARFGVEPWSREFYQIVFTIIERCSLVQSIVEKLDHDEDVKVELIGHVENIMQAFSAGTMRAPWGTHGNSYVAPVHVGPIKAISGLVRQKIAYRKLSDEELEELDGLIGALADWLDEQQLGDQDFIRQALIEGLGHLRFRLSKLKWLGWGYTLESLREVIAAYMLLERGEVDRAKNPDAAAVLQKVGALIKKMHSKVGAVKDVSDTADWLLRAYGAGSIIYQTGGRAIKGLIGSG